MESKKGWYHVATFVFFFFSFSLTNGTFSTRLTNRNREDLETIYSLYNLDRIERSIFSAKMTIENTPLLLILEYNKNDLFENERLVSLVSSLGREEAPPCVLKIHSFFLSLSLKFSSSKNRSL